MTIKIYTTPSCPYCLVAKNYFREKKINFEEIDISKDPKKAQEMIEQSGQMGAPVIKIDDEIIIGFDKDEIEKLLAKK